MGLYSSSSTAVNLYALRNNAGVTLDPVTSDVTRDVTVTFIRHPSPPKPCAWCGSTVPRHSQNSSRKPFENGLRTVPNRRHHGWKFLIQRRPSLLIQIFVAGLVSKNRVM